MAAPPGLPTKQARPGRGGRLPPRKRQILCQFDVRHFRHLQVRVTLPTVRRTGSPARTVRCAPHSPETAGSGQSEAKCPRSLLPIAIERRSAPRYSPDRGGGLRHLAGPRRATGRWHTSIELDAVLTRPQRTPLGGDLAAQWSPGHGRTQGVGPLSDRHWG